MPLPGHRASRPGVLRGLVLGGAALILLVIVGLAVSAGGGEERAGPQFVNLSPVPPLPNLPVGVPSASRPPSRVPTPPARPATAAEARHSPPPATEPVSSRAAARPRPSPSRAAFVAGATIGLSPAGAPGSRVRHQNFRARIDRIGASSTNLERADSRFVVRSAWAGPGCIAFESANYPGYFLRHRDFRIYLERVEASAQFAADATFCPSARDGGQALGSRNYPQLFIAERDARLVLAPQPLVFSVREPV